MAALEGKMAGSQYTDGPSLCMETETEVIVLVEWNKKRHAHDILKIKRATRLQCLKTNEFPRRIR